jgi:hypothetical protein
MKVLEMQRQMSVPPDALITPAAQFEGVSNAVIQALMQKRRETKLSDEIGAIGGYGQLTTVHMDGRMEQRILCRWDEDSIGGPIKPWPIDWKEWHRENPRPKSAKSLRIVR